MDTALSALESADLEWVTHIDAVWSEQPFHVDAINAEVRNSILHDLERIRAQESGRSPLGYVVVGPAGVGKTHLLGTLRRKAMDAGAGFVLVDMTDVRDFWDTALLGYIDSLSRPGVDGTSQFQRILRKIGAISGPRPDDLLGQWERAGAREIPGISDFILGRLLRIRGASALRHQDVVRALVMLSSPDFHAANVGFSRLQGLEIDEDDRKRFKFARAAGSAIEIVRSLSWVMSLAGPTILALDQLDAIVTQRRLAAAVHDENPETRAAHAIIEGVGGGLGALFDVTSATLVVVACLDATWEILRTSTLVAHCDRYRAVKALLPMSKAEEARELAALRLAPAYSRFGVSPPYPTWPFREEAFEGVIGLSPREILKECDRHRNKCVAEERVTELHDFIESESVTSAVYRDLGPEFDRFTATMQLEELSEEAGEDRLGALIQEGLGFLLQENPPIEHTDYALDVEFPESKTFPALHGRVRIVFRAEGDREEHFCVRTLQKENAGAYLARLKAALTASGIDGALHFRRLVILRSGPEPAGAKSKALTERFLAAGGVFFRPSDDELKALLALRELKRLYPHEFAKWSAKAKPASKLDIMSVIAPPLCRVLPDACRVSGQ